MLRWEQILILVKLGWVHSGHIILNSLEHLNCAMREPLSRMRLVLPGKNNFLGRAFTLCIACFRGLFLVCRELGSASEYSCHHF